MKILKIKLKNINSLRGEWKIDFEKAPLSIAGLFAITGPTGAGKSTILDAITLGLFNRIARFDGGLSKNSIDKAGSILTRNENDCYVEIEYSCKKGKFRSKWEISKARTGTMKDHHMEITNLQDGKLLDLKKSQVPIKNEELIGLTYDQCIKSILLSQGEFSKFLKSNKDERGKLLEDITGMQIYRELGKKAFETFRDKNESIKSQINTIEIEESQLLPNEKEKDLNASLIDINNNIKIKEIERNTTQTLLNIKESIVGIEKEIKIYSDNLKQETNHLNAFNQKNLENLNKHEKLLPYLKNIRAYNSNLGSIVRFKDNITQESKVLESSEENLKNSLKEIKSLVNLSATANNAIDILNDFRNITLSLVSKKTEYENAFSIQKQKILKLAKKPTLNKYNEAFIQNEFEKLKTVIPGDILLLNKQITSLNKKVDVTEEEIEMEKTKLDSNHASLIELKQIVINFSSYNSKNKENEKNISKLVDKIAKDIPILENLKVEKKEIADQLNNLREEIIKKNKELDLDEFRKTLKEGEPCPLCGSEHHPYVHEYFNNISELTKKLKALEKDDDAKQKQKEALEKEINLNRGNLNILKKEKLTLEKEIESSTKKINGFKKQLKIETIGTSKNVDDLIIETKQSIDTLIRLEKLYSEVGDLRDMENEHGELLKLYDSFVKANEELKIKYSGKDVNKDCNNLVQKVNTDRQYIESLKAKIGSYKNEIVRIEDEQENIESDVLSHIVKLGYANITSTLPDVIEDLQYQSFKTEQSKINENIKQARSLNQGAIKRKQSESIKDDQTKSKEEVSQELEQLNLSIQELRDNQIEVSSQKQENDKRKKRVRELKDQVAEIRNANLKWELLSRYIGDANGKNFSTFAQGLTLARLISIANIRLKKLNDRYLLDMPNLEEDDELMIIDTYLGWERRSVKTLSGGETFIVSLALALALSDLASKNVKIESLFIDEGFGTLDPETLDTAVSALEQLQAESNKIIGVISHVDSLKERIQTQIQLEKGSNGFSKINIKAH